MEAISHDESKDAQGGASESEIEAENHYPECIGDLKHLRYLSIGEFWPSLGVPVPQNAFSTNEIPSTIKVSTVPQQQHNMFVDLC
jgi:hypothetical protein